ncbi:hypothetical protein B0H63DRAFT_445238 [Podospora didyma]|uniref:Starter acyltransferase (SAT) domain-containing protein n=1 Tax=Podospora didyma TaxID=330526 RepID=A0AAE0P8J9_9PEZI|nr:hypothetical protein B0H63DRAFT_445238 [Podospora didyma]
MASTRDHTSPVVIQDLASLQLRGHLHPALHKALICTFQLAAIISRRGEQDDVFARGLHLYLVGLCTGSLAAATISCSWNVSDLLKLSPHAVRITFRTAFRAYEAAESIEHGSSSSTWGLFDTRLD